MPDVFFEISQVDGAAKARPVLKTRQDHVQAVPIPREQTRGIEELLEDLIVGCEPDGEIEPQLAQPEGESGLYRLRRKSCGNGDGGSRFLWECWRQAGGIEA